MSFCVAELTLSLIFCPGNHLMTAEIHTRLRTTGKEPLQNLCLNAKKPPTLRIQRVKRVYGTTLVTLVRLLIIFA